MSEKVVLDTQITEYSINRSRWVSITAIMTALALAGNYSLVFLPSVELGTLVLFVTAYVFGISMAVWSTLIMSVVFGFINPWGAFVFQIWLTQLIGWLFASSAGALLGKAGPEESTVKVSVYELGAIGSVLTLFFDLITNLGYSWAFGVPYLFALFVGLPFMVVHIISNSLLFSLVVPYASTAIRQTFGTLIWGVRDEQLTPDS